jgi:hippurate hydrolase
MVRKNERTIKNTGVAISKILKEATAVKQFKGKSPHGDILSTIKHYQNDLVRLRHDFHAHPELGFKEHRTATKVVALLRQWGYEVATGVGGTGVLGMLAHGMGKRSLGLRADMDALPITEATGAAYTSREHGRMHACGHDGHTVMLLGAARYLAENRCFNGRVYLIFQPAEETMEGAAAMIKDGLFVRFPVDAVFGMHNEPSFPPGEMAFRDGPTMASSDLWEVILTGKGSHSSQPEKGVDPVVAGAATVMALQTIVSRSVSPQQPTVVTVGSFQSGEASNVIPRQAILRLSIRTTDQEARAQVLERIRAVVAGQASSYGVNWKISEGKSNPVLVNDPQQTTFARQVARELLGHERVKGMPLLMASEDFALMLQERPGCYGFIGNGGVATVHNPAFDFNDSNLVIGAAYWSALAKRFLP